MPKRKASELSESLPETTNSLSIETFRQQFIDEQWLSYTPDIPQSHDIAYTLRSESAQSITRDDLEACFKLVERTSRQHYEDSSWGWHPRRKRKEMKDPEMRYLLVGHASDNALNGASKDSANVLGFLSFVITHDSVPSVPVSYIFEVHLDESLRGIGMGAHLMASAEHIAGRVGVQLVMLTCFMGNEKAHNFYKARGYVKDVSSPDDRTTRSKTIKVDYVILSKSVGRAVHSG